MAQGQIYLGEDTASLVLLSNLGRSFRESDIQITREERTANGRLVRDVVATKKEITLSYSMIDDADLQTYITFYALNDELVLRIFRNEVSYDDYTILMQPWEKERILCLGDGLWGNVEIRLTEV